MLMATILMLVITTPLYCYLFYRIGFSKANEKKWKDCQVFVNKLKAMHRVSGNGRVKALKVLCAFDETFLLKPKDTIIYTKKIPYEDDKKVEKT